MSYAPLRERDIARDVRKPPKGKNRMVGLFLDGIRAVSRHIRRATMEKFREFISALILPCFMLKLFFYGYWWKNVSY